MKMFFGGSHFKQPSFFSTVQAALIRTQRRACYGYLLAQSPTFRPLAQFYADKRCISGATKRRIPSPLFLLTNIILEEFLDFVRFECERGQRPIWNENYQLASSYPKYRA
jgi:hypothetical protein